MKIGVIGCGNMASAVVHGIHKHNKEVKFITYTPSFTRAKQLADEVNGTPIKELSDIIEADTIIIGCKPQQFSELASHLKDIDLTKKHILSIMAAVTVEQISEKLNTPYVTRLMPSLPMRYDEGISLLYYSQSVLDGQKEKIETIISGCSSVYTQKTQKQFDEVTTISASGPAYVYYFTKTFADILENELEVSAKDAKSMAIALFKGSSISMDKSDESLQEQIDRVTSKKGVTIEGVNSFKNSDTYEIFKKGVFAAIKRSEEITKGE